MSVGARGCIDTEFRDMSACSCFGVAERLGPNPEFDESPQIPTNEEEPGGPGKSDFTMPRTSRDAKRSGLDRVLRTFRGSVTLIPWRSFASIRVICGYRSLLAFSPVRCSSRAVSLSWRRVRSKSAGNSAQSVRSPGTADFADPAVSFRMGIASARPIRNN